MAIIYCSDKSTRRTSRAFYRELGQAIETDPATVEPIVKRAVEESISIWQEGKSRREERSMK
jgi:hypothetical protein